MNNSIVELKSGLQELKKFMKYNSLCVDVIKDEKLKNRSKPLIDLISLSEKFSRRKVFLYNSYIISVYGFFERFIENILSEYLIKLSSSVDSYECFPDKILKSHLAKVTKMLEVIHHPKYKNLNEKQVIEYTHKALNKNIPVLNIEAFQHHTSNFSHERVVDFFKQVGVDVSHIKNYEPLKTYLEDKHFKIDSINQSVLYERINDLAERRNEVAHGVTDIEILSSEIINDLIDLIVKYSISIHKILTEDLVKKEFEKKDKNFCLLEVYNKKIVCGKVKSEQAIYANKGVLIKRKEGNFPRFIEGKIKKIEVDNKEVTSFSSIDDLNIGIELDQEIKTNCEIIFV